MGLFRKWFGKEKEPLFEKVEEAVFTLSNQNGSMKDPAKEDLRKYLACLFADQDQFVTLTLAQAKQGVRFVQAAFAGDQLTVQLGLEENGKTRLVEKLCGSRACEEIFYRFYDFGMVDGVEEYTPVRF